MIMRERYTIAAARFMDAVSVYPLRIGAFGCYLHKGGVGYSSQQIIVLMNHEVSRVPSVCTKYTITCEVVPPSLEERAKIETPSVSLSALWNLPLGLKGHPR